MLTAAVVGTDAKSSGNLRACLQQTGLVRSVMDWAVSSERYPHSSESIPDVLLLDMAHEMEPFFAFAAQLHLLRPSVCIIACSHLQQPTPAVLMQAMRSGVSEFLPRPVDAAALKEILARLIKERGATQMGAEKLVVVMGSKGGVGATTVTVNLGVQLAQISEKRVVVLDLARPLGHVALLLDIQARFSIRDAVDNLERLDAHFFGGLLTAHKSGLQFLAGTSNPDEWLHIPVPALVRVASVAQSSCDLALVDLGADYSSAWSELLHLARTIILVGEADVPSLWALERHVSTMVSFGLDPERIRIIINRWHRGDEEALKAFENKIRRPIFARLPNDFRQVSEATNLGVPLSKNHNDPLVSRFRQLASEFSGISPAPPGAKRAGILNLFTPPKR